MQQMNTVHRAGLKHHASVKQTDDRNFMYAIFELICKITQVHRSNRQAAKFDGTV